MSQTNQPCSVCLKLRIECDSLRLRAERAELALADFEFDPEIRVVERRISHLVDLFVDAKEKDLGTIKKKLIEEQTQLKALKYTKKKLAQKIESLLKRQRDALVILTDPEGNIDKVIQLLDEGNA